MKNLLLDKLRCAYFTFDTSLQKISFQVFSHVTTARPNLPRPPSLAELHLPRPPQLGNCFPKRSEPDLDFQDKLSGLQAHLANIQPPTLGGKFHSLKSLGGNSGGCSQASSSTGEFLLY